MSNFRHQLAAWIELWQRYRSHFSHYWTRRQEITMPALKQHEAEFLPSALALQAAPISPTGRWTARLLMLLVLFCLIWSIFGKMDIIVSANGKIIPSTRVKTIASVETARVEKITVSEGQTVHTGDILLMLDTRLSDHERIRAEGERDMALLQVARSRAFLSSIAADRLIGLTATHGINPGLIEEAQQQLRSQWLDFVAKRQRIDAEVARYRAQEPLLAQRVKDYEELARRHDVTIHAWLEKVQEQVDLAGKHAEAMHQRDMLTAEVSKNAKDALTEGLKFSSAFHQDAMRAGVRSSLMVLKAPVDGTVQQLAAHTVGGVVTVGQALMVIVPKQDQVEIEAFVENKDIGFVREGMQAAIKIETFEYTKYGMVKGKVSHISRDAVETPANAAADNSITGKSIYGGKSTQSQSPMYSVKIMLEDNKMMVDGKQEFLSPGMSASIEIKTGTRRIIEYLLSPLLKHAHESLNER